MNFAEGAPARYSQFTLKHASRPVSTPTVRHRIAEQELPSPGRARKGQEGPGGARKGRRMLVLQAVRIALKSCGQWVDTERQIRCLSFIA